MKSRQNGGGSGNVDEAFDAIGGGSAIAEAGLRYGVEVSLSYGEGIASGRPDEHGAVRVLDEMLRCW